MDTCSRTWTALNIIAKAAIRGSDAAFNNFPDMILTIIKGDVDVNDISKIVVPDFNYKSLKRAFNLDTINIPIYSSSALGKNCAVVCLKTGDVFPMDSNYWEVPTC